MSVRLRALIVFLAVLSFTGISESSEIEGKIYDVYPPNLLLLDMGGGQRELVLLRDGAEVENLSDVLDERVVGERIRATYAEEAAGVRVAEKLSFDPVVELPEPEMKILTPEISGLIEARGKYALIDVRPGKIYKEGHIPTAVSLPYHEFRELLERSEKGEDVRIKALPDDNRTSVVFYARSERDPTALMAAEMAMALGYTDVRVYNKGLKGWIRDKNWVTMPLEQFRKFVDAEEPIVIIDSRPRHVAESSHIPGAVSMPFKDLDRRNIMVPTLPESMVVYGRDANDKEAAEFAKKAAYWGYASSGEAPVHVLEGGFEAWREAGLDVESGKMEASIEYVAGSPGVIRIEEFREIWEERPEDKLALDVRGGTWTGEFTKDFILQIPIVELPYRVSELPKDREIIAYCAFGYRARMAYYMLGKLGYKVRYLNRAPMMRSDGTLVE